MAEELERYLNGYIEDLKTEIDPDGKPVKLAQKVTAALIIESDAPCDFDLTLLEVPYQLISKNTFTSGQEKHVIRFSGAGP